MRLTSLLTVSSIVAGITATPVQFPLPDGFPNPSPDQLAVIQNKAQGTLPNGPNPTSLTDTATSIIQLLALNEIFETAYFTQLLSNITTNVPGYKEKDLAGLDRKYVIDTITAIVNQEQLHALGLNGILKSSSATPINPCTFAAPVQSFTQAITLAATFTDIVLGALPQAQTLFGSDAGDETPLVSLIGSVLGQEGEQDGFFRFVQKKTPSAAPFLTPVGPSFAFSALKLFIVPGSCPQADEISLAIPTFAPLNVVKQPPAKNSTVMFSVGGSVSAGNNSIVYISGQNLPVTVPISTPVGQGGMNVFSAPFPFDEGFANGLTIAALVKGCGKFNGSDAVAAATVYGPGLIEVG